MREQATEAGRGAAARPSEEEHRGAHQTRRGALVTAHLRQEQRLGELFGAAVNLRREEVVQGAIEAPREDLPLLEELWVRPVQRR